MATTVFSLTLGRALRVATSKMGPSMGIRRPQQMILSMNLQTGIVGLPNVGKSSLFNALVGGEVAQASNYPFCTIDPNVGLVNVPDPKLVELAAIYSSEKIIPATLEIVDIAGIVKGASEGAGLGNKFLANIRSTDAVVHVVRCFTNENIIHVDGTVDPIRDVEIISLELVLADYAQVEKRVERAKKDKKCTPEELSALDKLLVGLSNGTPARMLNLTPAEKEAVKGLMLLTLKPMIYAANVADNDLAAGNELSAKVFDLAEKEGCKAVLVSAQVESELAQLDDTMKDDFLETLGVSKEKCGLPILLNAAYSSLGLQTYYTMGPKEARAWTINKGMTAPQAAGVIHSDFEKGFIRAEIVSYDDIVKYGNEKAVREKGLFRSEGKDYVMQEGDVVLFRFN